MGDVSTLRVSQLFVGGSVLASGFEFKGGVDRVDESSEDDELEFAIGLTLDVFVTVAKCLSARLE
jgi:hypothetical protein